ncbi:MAG: penicillin-binding transpeptidase domain-containing protein, partial [Defluviitaleaceae bacterium]|nr:penicillin-binding transpeptidase domain-containing protein [Defluviitaleaceae bacterium]
MLRSALYLQRWNVAQVGLAVDISRQTVAALEEFGHALPGLYVAYDYLRYYPQGRYMTNIVGYLARISPANLETYGHLGYTATDLFGAMGAERAFEHELRGTRGETTLELDNNRRRVGVVGHTAPIAGQDIFLTVDSVLQRNIYYIIEGHLADILLTRLRAQGLVFAREVLDSILRSNNINSLLIMNTEDAEEFPASYAVRNFVLTNGDIDSNVDATRFRTNLNNFIGDNILSGHISTTTMFDIMAEQGIIEFAPYESAQLRAGQLSASAFLIRLVENRQLTPQIINIDPATASVAISCVHTGGIIAAVNYPTFDGNNFLPHRRDNAYINHLNVDRSNPQFPRAFMETQPPGSTFKMVTALAGLSQGVITPQTRIFDRVVFRDAGWPYLSCMGSHGSINVVDAIAVSCNYFFNRVAFNLGGRRTQEGMAALNYYMRALGLGEPTGVEISEARMFMPSPQWRIDDGRAGNWTDGNTIQLSIGQGYADFTVLSMAKVMATLATGGTRMQMHLLNRMVDANGNVTPHVPVIEYQLPIDTLHVEAIHRGMREVVTRGTGANIFRNFPMEVAVKSGTAEVSGIRMSHSSYGGFAPYRDPQIAIYTIVPHGDTPHLRGSSGHVTRDVLAEFFGLNNTAPEDDSNGFIR